MRGREEERPVLIHMRTFKQSNLDGDHVMRFLGILCQAANISLLHIFLSVKLEATTLYSHFADNQEVSRGQEGEVEGLEDEDADYADELMSKRDMVPV